MRVIIANDYNDLSKRAAAIIANQLWIKPDSVLGLATGSTPVGTYEQLIHHYKEEGLPFDKMTAFNLDEYYGLSKEHDQSYAYFMQENLFKHVGVQAGQLHIPNGLAEDIQAECLNYEAQIKKAGGIDLQLLGIGRNGHIGFNEPDLKFEAKTHLVELDQDTIDANARFFESAAEVPRTALSMGVKTIMHAKKILLLASGASKADALLGMLFGQIKPDLPASALQLHPDVVIIADKEAAAKIMDRLEEVY
jgi:glucosamine-6-phosphate deaminase